MSPQISDPKQLIVELGKLSQAADTLKHEISETDRVAALKMARQIAQSLEKPREEVLKMSYSVSFADQVRAFKRKKQVEQVLELT